MATRWQRVSWNYRRISPQPDGVHGRRCCLGCSGRLTGAGDETGRVDVNGIAAQPAFVFCSQVHSNMHVSEGWHLTPEERRGVPPSMFAVAASGADMLLISRSRRSASWVPGKSPSRPQALTGNPKCAFAIHDLPWGIATRSGRSRTPRVEISPQRRGTEQKSAARGPGGSRAALFSCPLPAPCQRTH